MDRIIPEKPHFFLHRLKCLDSMKAEKCLKNTVFGKEGVGGGVGHTGVREAWWA